MSYRADLLNYATSGQYFDDLLNIGLWDFRAGGTGASTGPLATPLAGRPGIGFIATGSTSGGVASGNFTGLGGTNDANFIFGGGSFIYTASFNNSAISNGTDNFQWYVGMHDGWQFNTPSNGTYLLYDIGTSPNWQYITNNNGTSTAVTSTLAVTSGWHKIIIEGTPTSVTFIVDGTVLGTTTTNLPTSAGYSLSANLIKKTLGTTSIIILQDYLMFNETLTTLR